MENMMKKTLITISNVLAFVAFLCLMATGSIIHWVLPPGSGGLGRGGGFGRGRHLLEGDRVQTLLGWGRHDWGSLHYWLAVAFVCIMVLHLVLNWAWIRNTFFSRKKTAEQVSCP